jgi:hypothetical protein
MVTSKTFIREIIAKGRVFLKICHEYGTVRTLQLLSHELLFDLRHGTNTIVEMENVVLSRGAKYEGYEGTNPLLFSELFRNLTIDLRKSAFLDYGSGKGRALFLAVEHGFRKAIGVEFSEALCAIARTNIDVCHAQHPSALIDLHCCNAASFEVPEYCGVLGTMVRANLSRRARNPLELEAQSDAWDEIVTDSGPRGSPFLPEHHVECPRKRSCPSTPASETSVSQSRLPPPELCGSCQKT